MGPRVSGAMYPAVLDREGSCDASFLGHLHRCAPIREGDLHASNLARAAAMRRSDEKVLRLKIAPNDARLFQLVQTLSHLKHDVELDRGGEERPQPP